MSSDTPANHESAHSQDEETTGRTVEVGSFAETDGAEPETVTSSRPVGSFADTESADDDDQSRTEPEAKDEKHETEVGSFDNETQTVTSSERIGSFADQDQ